MEYTDLIIDFNNINMFIDFFWSIVYNKKNKTKECYCEIYFEK